MELRLPVSEVVEAAHPPEIEADNRRALIVDDIDVNRHILSEQLEAWGFRPDTASCGAEALNMLRTANDKSDPYAFAILDFFMPEMDGEQLAREIRGDEMICDTALMVLTLVDRPGDARRFRELGVDGYLVKPARSSLLLQTISNLLCAGDETKGDATAAVRRGYY